MFRGVKFKFSPGENVLCFEPDPTKARVIYEAKILDTTAYRDTEGKRQPGYHIHFLRWNNSWDRVVGECFVLKNTEENRALMKQLAEIARKVSKNKTRRKKIQEILSKAFEGKHPPFESEGEESDEGETTDTTDTKSMEDESVAETNSVTSDSKTEDQKKKVHTIVTLDIPDSLKVILDKDFFAINQDKKLIKLPAEINVVTVLESFVKRFVLDFWSPNFDRSQFCHVAPKIAVERLVPMCKEFVDGLRICFDFLLPLILLYGSEKNQYNKISTQFKHRSPVKPNIQTGESPLIHSDRPSIEDPLLREEEPLPKLPKLSPNVIDETVDSEISFPHQQIAAPRRVTRSKFHETLKKSDDDVSKTEDKDKHKGCSSKSDKKQTDHKGDKECVSKSLRTRRSSERLEDTPVRRRALRNLRKSSDVSTESDQSKPETIQSEPAKTASIKCEKVERPPPLLIPCNLPARQNGDEKEAAKGAPGSTDSIGDSGKEEIMEDIMLWQMLPPEIQTQVPTLPSALYGPQHLLRLFVKLPDLLGKMDMDENKLGVLIKLMQRFLMYMSEHVVELFSEAAYVRASEG